MSSYEESVKKVDEKKQAKENQSNHSSSFSSFNQVSNKIDQIIQKEPTSKTTNNEEFQKEEDESFIIEPREQLEKKPIQPEFKTDVSIEPTINKIDEKEELFEISTPEKPKKSLSIPIHISKPKKADNNQHESSGKCTNNESVTNFFHNTDSRSEDSNSPKKKMFQFPFNLFSNKEKTGSVHNTSNHLNMDQLPIEQKQTDEKKKNGFNLFKKDTKKEKDDACNEKVVVESPDQNESTPVQQTVYEHATSTNQSIDEEVLKLLAITDELLGKLPEDVISEFAASEDFVLYEKVMKKYHILKDES